MVIKHFCRESRLTKMGLQKLVKLVEEAKAATGVITLEATVPTGFEFMALEECREKCKPISCFRGIGRVFMNIKTDSYSSVVKLRSVDNIFMVSDAIDDVKFTWRKEEDLAKVQGIVDKIEWDKSVQLWAEIKGFKGVIFPECGQNIPASAQVEQGLKCHKCRGPEVTLDSSPAIELENPPGIVEGSDGIVEPEPAEVQIILPQVITPIPDEQPEVATEPAEATAEAGSNQLVDGVRASPTLLCVEKVAPNNPESDEDAFFSAEEEDVKQENPDCSCPAEACGITPVSSSETTAPLAVGAQDETTQEREMSTSGIDPPGHPPAVQTTIDDTLDLTTVQDGQAKPVSKESKIVKMRKERKERNKNRRENKKEKKAPPRPFVDDNILKFRVTCHRNGKRKHSFESNDAAGHFGGIINDYFHWTVDLTRFDINVVLVIEGSSAYVTYGLTDSSFHRRNLVHLGPTTLRATMCYGMVRLAEPTPGDIIIDPLCGGGSISIEGAIGFPATFHVCGDHHERAMFRASGNIEHNSPINANAVCWDALSLPLRDKSFDILVTDLPFGLRMGRNQNTLHFYLKVLKEFGRIVRCTGRAVLLTYDVTAFTKALQQNAHIWHVIESRLVNHGGLRCSVFLLMKKATQDATIPPKMSSNPSVPQPEMSLQQDSTDEARNALETLSFSDTKVKDDDSEDKTDTPAE